MSNSTSNTESTSTSLSTGETRTVINLEALVPYKGLILSATEKLIDGINLLSLIINKAEVPATDSQALRALNTIFQSTERLNYHVATVRDIYESIGKKWNPTTRFFNFSPDGEIIEEVDEENYNGTPNSEIEEIPSYL